MPLKAYSKYIGVTVVFVLVLSIIFSSSLVHGAEDTITINVTIQSYASIMVNPSSINYTDVNPGADNNTVNFSVKNSGSANLSQMFAYTSTITDESSNPLGSGSATNYASTGFIMISNNTNSQWYHAGRLEWNLSSILDGEVLDLATGTTDYGHGYYRNATEGDYLWKLENGTGGVCNDTGSNLTIITTPENGTGQHRDFTSEAHVSGTLDAQTANWSIFSFTSGPLAGHCVAGFVNCTKIFVYKYDQRTSPDDFTGCNVDSWFDNSTLIAGEEISGRVLASIPQGTPEGQAIVGTLTFSAS